MTLRFEVSDFWWLSVGHVRCKKVDVVESPWTKHILDLYSWCFWYFLLYDVSGQISSRPHTTKNPKWLFSKGNLLISGKSRLVKYYSIWPDVYIPRHTLYIGWWSQRFLLHVFISTNVRSPKDGWWMIVLSLSLVTFCLQYQQSPSNFDKEKDGKKCTSTTKRSPWRGDSEKHQFGKVLI